MIPKIEGCIHALDHGVGSVHLIDGRVPHVLLLELFTAAGVGTMLTATGGDAGAGTAPAIGTAAGVGGAP
jgi:acetylglutamate kinase